jgi:hypothetical protein
MQASFEIGLTARGGERRSPNALKITLRARGLIPALEAFAKDEGVTLEASPDDANVFYLPLKDSDMRVRLQASLWEAAYGAS